MATIKTAQTGDWNDTNTWVGGVVPAPCDAAVIDDTHVVTVTADLAGVNPDSLAADTAPDTGTIHFGSYEFQVGNIIELDRLTATAGGATFQANSIDLGPDGTLTLTDDCSLTGDFLLDGGEIAFGPYRIAVFGDITRTSGTDSADTGGGFDVSQDADVVWANSYSFIEWGILAGVTATVTGGVGGRKFIADATSSIVGGGNTLTIWNPNANNYLSLPVGVADNLNVQARSPDGRTNSYDVDTGGGTYFLFPASAFGTVTQSGDLYCSTCTLQPYADGTTETFNMDGRLIATGIVTLGGAPNRSCILNLSDKVHSIGGLVHGNAANENNELNLGACTLLSTGTVDGNNDEADPMVVTASGANLHGGTIQDTTVTGLIHAWGVTDGAGNTNVAHESSIGPGANVGTGIGMAA